MVQTLSSFLSASPMCWQQAAHTASHFQCTVSDNKHQITKRKLIAGSDSKGKYDLDNDPLGPQMRSMDAREVALILTNIHGDGIRSFAKSCLSQAESEANEISMTAWHAVLEALDQINKGRIVFTHVHSQELCVDVNVTELRERSRRFRSLAEAQNDPKTKRALLDTAEELELKACEAERRQSKDLTSAQSEA